MFPMDPNLPGFWAPHTATVNWCEHDYAVWSGVAEFHNTWSNLLFIALPALFGLRRCWLGAGSSSAATTTAAATTAAAAGAAATTTANNTAVVIIPTEGRFWLCYGGLLVVGVGSTYFHATLRWEGQLCDELPMLWINAVFFFCLLEPPAAAAAAAAASPVAKGGGSDGGGEEEEEEEEAGRRRRRRQQLLLALCVYCVVVTAVYVALGWYDIFVVCYGGGVVYLVLACARISWRPATTSGTTTTTVLAAAAAAGGGEGGRLLRAMYARAVCLYGAGFLLWNIDNHPAGCAARHALQAAVARGGARVGAGALAVPPSLSWLCELHMWWHFFAGTGTYAFIVWLQLLRGLQLGRVGLGVAWGGGGGLLPYVVWPAAGVAGAGAGAAPAAVAPVAVAAAVAGHGKQE